MSHRTIGLRGGPDQHIYGEPCPVLRPIAAPQLSSRAKRAFHAYIKVFIDPAHQLSPGQRYSIARIVVETRQRNARWDLPPLVSAQSPTRLCLDEALLRGEMHWIHAIGREVRGTGNARSAGIILEEELGRTFRTDLGASNPFNGMVQSLFAAAHVGVVSSESVSNTVASARNSDSASIAWRVLRVAIQEASQALDFPRFTEI